MEHRTGPFRVNASGGQWWPLDPRPDDFSIEDIAHHLALTCRYGGATRFFYSVAEHSVLVSYHVPPHLALHGLLHDAAEAVVGDTIQPIKMLPEWEAVRRVEDLNFRAICRRFGLAWGSEIDEVVGEVDRRLVTDEVEALIPGGAAYLEQKGWPMGERLGADVVAYSPERAEVAFMLRYLELTEGRP